MLCMTFLSILNSGTPEDRSSEWDVRKLGKE